MLFSSIAIERISLFVPVIDVVASVKLLHIPFCHFAILLAVMPFTVVKIPPTNKLPLLSNFILEIGPSVPEPIEDHVVPSQNAILFALIPPI